MSVPSPPRPALATASPAGRLAPIALALALGVVGGTVARQLRVPLAWMIGPMVVTAAATGLPFAVAFLSLAPAGITEMVLTAKIMRLDATVVTAFQIVRSP